jgi:murein DD-endopeptidase MepM/ murein hydrolase activator NlpD
MRERQRAAVAAEVAAEEVSAVEAEVAEPAATDVAPPEASPIEGVPATDAETLAASTAESDADAFTAASRAFSFTASASATEDSEYIDDESATPSLPTAATAVPSGRSASRRRFVAAGATVGVMGIAGLLAVSMTFPAEALAAAQGVQGQASISVVAGSEESVQATDDEIQAYVASSDLQNEAIQRAEGFSTASLIDLATQQGISYSSDVYTNDPDAAIQWPFIVGVSMTYGYGMRDGRLHEGLDLVPGDGAPVQAIADGKVRIATESGGNYGVTVYIDHMIDGQLITSHYSHMQYGSLQVETGDTVKVGDIVGKVGNTGRSYGAHMHFELIVDGSTIDPLPWMNENAGRHEGVSPVS